MNEFIKDIKLLLEYRNMVFKFLRKYLENENFVEVHTPKIVSIATDPIRGGKKETLEVFSEAGRKVGLLAQSPQMFKQIAISYGLHRIYEISPYWRNNIKETERHNIEFWCLDIEMDRVSVEEDLIIFLEDMIRDISSNIQKEYNITIGEIKYPIPRISYDHAIEILNNNDIDIQWGADIGFRREKILGMLLRKKFGDLFFIKKYPLSVKKFYTKVCDDKRYTHTFDLIFKGWEICSGAIREVDPNKIKKKMKNFNLNLNKYSFYLKIFQNGIPEHGGFGFGIDRFIAKTLNVDNINEIYVFH